MVGRQREARVDPIGAAGTTQIGLLARVFRTAFETPSDRATWQRRAQRPW